MSSLIYEFHGSLRKVHNRCNNFSSALILCIIGLRWQIPYIFCIVAYLNRLKSRFLSAGLYFAYTFCHHFALIFTDAQSLQNTIFYWQ